MVALVGIATASSPGFAAVSTLSYYRLGENSPDAVAGQPAPPSLPDSGARSANVYRARTAPVCSTNTGVTGSTMAIVFNGGGYTNRAALALTDNWGIEAWVKAARKVPSLTTDGYATIVFGGDSGANGMGILQGPDGRFKGLCGGVGFAGSATVVTGAWTHLAIVAAGGAATLYVNGVAAGTGASPHAPSDYFGVGLNPVGYGGYEPFQGTIDEVRVFGFASGQFSTNDLLLHSAGARAEPPVILSGPTLTPPGTIPSGTAFSLTVSLGGTGPFTYQWRANGVDLASATNATLTFSSARISDSGDYSVVVGNSYGSITSSVAQVSVQTLAQALTNAVQYLETKSREMVQAARHVMPNGVAAYPPQVGSGYDAFWLRDYAYMLEGAAAEFSTNDLLQACQLFVSALRSDGAGVDCVRYSGQPIYKPGYGTMGDNPVADGSQFTVDVAWYTYQQTKDQAFLKKIVDALVKTMRAAPRNSKTGLIYIKPGGWDRCPYGFTDSVRQQGDVLFCSLLYVQACRQLAELLEAAERPEDARLWRTEAEKLPQAIRDTFWDESVGLFRAATVYCGQHDIWGSAFAVWLGVTTPEQSATVAKYFKQHYGEIVQAGQIRHLPGGVYWDAACAKDTYQNGAFWATATGWFVYTLNQVDPDLADRTLVDLVGDFQARGVNEWVFGSTLGVTKYLSSVTLPLAGAKRMLSLRHPAPRVIMGPGIRPSSVVAKGRDFSLSVIASGETPLQFQWRRGGVPLQTGDTSPAAFTNVALGGSTLASVTFASATEALSGDYDVVILNDSGAATSTVVSVTVAPVGNPTLLPVAYYRMGENDPGAAVSLPCGATSDAVSGASLAVLGNVPEYSADTGVPGSALGIKFTGGGYGTNMPIALTDNWGIEAWVNALEAVPTLSTDGYATIVVNGDTAHNGVALLQTPSGQFAGLCGNVALVGGSAVLPGVWTHLALVVSQGVTTFYVDGAAVGTAGSPLVPTTCFGIGYNPAGYGGGEPFKGGIDEVRVFTFAPGQFSTKELLQDRVPPPSTRIFASGNNVIVVWAGQSLQEATNIDGPWSAITNPTRPWLVPASGSGRFFRALQE